MDENQIIESLSPIERIVLPKLTTEFQTSEEISKISEIDKTSTFRAIGFLKNKELVQTREETKTIVDLGILGINYSKKELPERALLNKLQEKKAIPISQIRPTCNLNENEAKIALGTLKRKALIEIKKGRIELTAKIEEIKNKMPEEILLEKLPLELQEIKDLDKLSLENLKSRKDIVEIIEQKIISAKLTNLGEKISKLEIKDDMIEALTPKIIKQNSWKGKKFRRYDLSTPVPKVYGGKRHFVNQASDFAKSIWLEMGFKEMHGNLTQTSLWVFDSLFTAQDHPVREMQDTFFIKDIVGKIKQEDREITQRIKKAHETGVDKSLGWQQAWKESDAKKVLLRTHTTALSSNQLKEIAKTNEFPAKYFALGKCFRNETVDWSHGFEFNQTEGIVVDENANFRQLLGYLKQFFSKMGYDKIRIRPAYFPYTEPSLEIDVFDHKHNKWLELGGAGMFRPEVTVPIFGRHVPVLAWGPGFDRIITQFFGIEDLREMYKNDINKLREMKFWIK